MRQATSEERKWFVDYEDIIDRNYGGHLAAYKKELKARDRTIMELRDEIARLRAGSDRSKQ